MEEIFIQLAIILFIAFVISYIARLFKQPLIIGYIITGMIIGPFIIYSGVSKEITDIFSHFGIAFLLFIVGLHLNPKVIKEIGIASLLIGLAQIILTFGATFLVSLKLLGFDAMTSAYAGIAIAFSSTIIIMKLLSDEGQLESLYGKISIGILIIQDLVAVGVLIIISSLSGGADFGFFTTNGLLMGGGLVFILLLVGFFVLPFLTKNIAKSQELLFLFSICWCFIVAALFSKFGFTIEIGALVAGVILSVSPYSIEISSKVRPLRDFFLIIFFIILGLSIQISNIGSVIVAAIVLSLISLIFKPLILMIMMALFGYTKRNNFLVGVTLSQISEFSVIILTLGVAVGHLTSEILSTIALTLIITIILSTYMIIYSEKIYLKISKHLSIFERKKIKESKFIDDEYEYILFGENRVGFSIMQSFIKMKKNYLIVDFNPQRVKGLLSKKINCIYGDLSDSDFLDSLKIDKAKLIVSTVPEMEINLVLINKIRKKLKNAIVIVNARQISDAFELYKAGADYVILPHFLGGEYTAKIIEEFGDSKAKYRREKKKQIENLKERLRGGQRHPDVEKD